MKTNLLTGLLNRIKVGVGGSGVQSSSPPADEGADDNNGGSTSTSTSTHAPPTTPVATTVLVVDSSGCGPTITTLSPTPSSSPRPASQDRSPVDGQQGRGGKVKRCRFLFY